MFSSASLCDYEFDTDPLLSGGTGYIYLEDWKDFGLKEGKEALDGKRKPRKGKTYAVTAFHELHCLVSPACSIYQLIDN